LFVIPASLLSISSVPAFLSFFSWTFLLVEVHIFSQGETYMDIKSASTVLQGIHALITLFSNWYQEPPNTHQAKKTPPVF
jgi:hypothetical protein